ncbi:MAG: hypothetical protein AVDCRST_MAG59-970, partial [uncultured Thermomicrobiales bacterium]
GSRHVSARSVDRFPPVSAAGGRRRGGARVGGTVRRPARAAAGLGPGGAQLGRLGLAPRHPGSARRLPLLGRPAVRLLRRHRDGTLACHHGGHVVVEGGRRRPGRHELRLPGRLLARRRGGDRPRLGLADGRLRRLRHRFREGPHRHRHGRRPAGQAGRPGRHRLVVDRRPDGSPGGWRSGRGPVRRRRSGLGSGPGRGSGRCRPLLGGAACPVVRPGARLRLHPRQGLVEVPGKLVPDPADRLRGRGAGRPLHPLPARLGDGAGVRLPEPAGGDPDHDGGAVDRAGAQRHLRGQGGRRRVDVAARHGLPRRLGRACRLGRCFDGVVGDVPRHHHRDRPVDPRDPGRPDHLQQVRRRRQRVRPRAGRGGCRRVRAGRGVRGRGGADRGRRGGDAGGV